LEFILIFFFSSRRRHTRFSRDWSSDVCSSDLAARPRPASRTRNESPSPPPVLRQQHPPGELPSPPAPCRSTGLLCQPPQRERVRSEERRVGKECRRRW